MKEKEIKFIKGSVAYYEALEKGFTDLLDGIYEVEDIVMMGFKIDRAEELLTIRDIIKGQ